MNTIYDRNTSVSNFIPRFSYLYRIFNLLSHPLHRKMASTVRFLTHTAQMALKNHLSLQQLLHPYGYCYVPIVCNRLMELLILQWSAGAESKPHCHGASINFTKVLSGQVLERKFHISGGKLRVISERVIQAGQWAWTLPFEIHELVTINDPAETLHLYFPGRVC
jgi:hypothetical protein